MSPSCYKRSSPEVQEPSTIIDVSNINISKMAKRILQDTTEDLKKLSELVGTSTSTTTPENTTQELPKISLSRVEMNSYHMILNHMTICHVITKEQLRDDLDKIIKATESITAVETVTPESSLFFLKQQSPTAHLSILRNPTKCYQMDTPAFSPELGHTSDAYIRFNQRQYLKAEITIHNGDYIDKVTNRAHRIAQLKSYQKAKKESNRIQRDHDSWVFNRKPAQLILAKMTEDAAFWRSFKEDCVDVTNEAGEKVQEWTQNNTPDLIGESIEREMQFEGRSLNEWPGLKKAVEDAEQEERHQRMVKHRDQYRQSKYIPVNYDSVSDDEDSEDDGDEGYYYLYDFVDPVPVIYDGEVPEVEEDLDDKKYEDWQLHNFVDAVSGSINEEGSEDGEDSEDEEDDDWQIYDFIDSLSGKISEADTKEGEGITKVPASSTSDSPQLEISNTQDRRDLLQQRVPTLHKYPDNQIVKTNTTLAYSAESTTILACDPQSNDASNSASQTSAQDANMAPSTTETTKEVLTETGAILAVAQTLVADLSERHEFYHRQSNVHMNTVLDALKPKSLGYHCNWTVRPMAMTKKNLDPPPADQPPAIRLINPAGVTCELIEGFQDLSHPDFEQYFAEREKDQYHMAQVVKEWRDNVETFEEYYRRLVCEEFWDRCQTQEIRRALEEQRIECEENDLFEDDSDDDDDWDEYTFSRTSRSSSTASSLSDLEDSSVANPIGEEQITTNTDTDNENEHPTALEIARTNLAEYTVILSKAVAVTKAAEIRARNPQIQAPILAKEAALKAGTKQHLPQRLSFSITRLRLQMAQEGLLPDKTGFKYTSTQLTGPGSITFVGPITKFLTTRKVMHDIAFEQACQNPIMQAFGKTDVYKEVKVSMAHVTDLWRDVRGVSAFGEESRAAHARQEAEGKEVNVVLGQIFGDAERMVLEVQMVAQKNENMKQEKVEKKAAEKEAKDMGVNGVMSRSRKVEGEIGVGWACEKGREKGITEDMEFGYGGRKGRESGRGKRID
ncbi:hypothetical protein ACEPPN_007113 [Leptodophora sp. 'Broadleaf-Isolate-01']